MSRIINKVKQKFSRKSTTTDEPMDNDTSSSSSSSGDEGTFGSGKVKKWHSNKAYNVGDEVSYKGVTYKCLVSHTSMKGMPPSMDTTNWTTVTPATPVAPVV